MGAPISMEKLDVFENAVFWSIFVKTLFYAVYAYGRRVSERVSRRVER